MTNFLKSFQPFLKRLKKYSIEIILLTTAFIITVVALIVYVKDNQTTTEEIDNNYEEQTSRQGKIFIDVSGAVKKPNLYEFDFGARIKEIIDKAGGLSDDADIIFFSRNFNLARIITDQEKIYVPSISEINNGIFIQNTQSLNYIEPNLSLISNQQLPINNSLINLNSATIEELDQLPGVGQVTANKIISNRPYTTVDELIIKKVVNKGIFEKIKDLVSL